MTSSTDTSRHPDVSEISDLTEGLLSPSRASVLRRHLDGCELCADVQHSLEEIRGLLGTLPGPTPVPADIAGRIDAALAAEALLSSTAPAEPNTVSRETSAAMTPETPTSAPDRPVGHARGTIGPGRSRRARRRTAVFGAVLGAAAVGVSVILLQSGSFTSSDSDVSQKSSVSTASDSTGEFSGRPVGDRVHTLLADGATPAEPRMERAPSSEDQAPSVSPKSSPSAPVPSCIQRGTGRTEPLLAYEQGRYADTEAYLVVLPHTSDSTQVEAYVIDSACVGNPDTPVGALLATDTFPLH